MARTLEVTAPSGIATPSFQVINAADTVIDTISLTEATNSKGKYSGPLTTQEVGIHHGLLLNGATLLGSFNYVRVRNLTPDELVRVGDSAGVSDGIKLGQTTRYTNTDTPADSLPFSHTEE